ncbi:MAG: hypothetical protein ACLQVX_00310, partial [Limisphaerales bacterium]
MSSGLCWSTNPPENPSQADAEVRASEAEAAKQMLSILFTLDYEIPGSGRGDPLKLMVEPTARLLDELERHGLKLTIMADVAEILRFKEYAEQSG